jgi:hypothetical protein
VGRTWGGRQKLRRNGRSFFVHPQSGRLEEVPASRVVPPRPAPHRLVRDGKLCIRHRGVWYAIEEGYGFSWSRARPEQGWDVLLKMGASSENADEREALYGEHDVVAAVKTPLNRKALKALGLWRR